MSVLWVALPVALAMAATAVAAFLWAVRTGQFDDVETPAVRILFEDPAKRRSQSPAGPPASKEKPWIPEVERHHFPETGETP